jgi:hypothetical protein
MADDQTSPQDPYYLIVAFIGGVYLTLLGLSLLFAERGLRWFGLFPLGLGCALLYIASQLIRTGLSTRTPLLSRVRPDPLPDGVELEAEILARYEMGALQGSELAKARQGQMASWDPLELELRYVSAGREIVSRGRVSTETFFHTRGMKTLKIKILPDRPEDWVALG